MATLLGQLLSLAAAGTMLLSTSLDAAAPHNDIDGLLFLTNRQWRVSKAYVPARRFTDVPGQVRYMREDASLALEEMYAACKEEIGITLKAVSGYRSYPTQNTLYNRKVDSTGSKTKADEYVARPGASEHQLALAMDVGQKDKVSLTAGFGSTKGGKWVRENCWRFGFILRYDEGWEEITGYEYEPWHVRYVVKEYAAMLHENPEPLETFLISLRTQRMEELLLVEIPENN